MKNILLIGFISMLFAFNVFSQNTYNGGHFVKRIEYKESGVINLDNVRSKGNIEKRFYGPFNAPFEFFHDPAFAHMGIYGFRLISDSLKNTYVLEIKSVVNLNEMREKIQYKYPVRKLSSCEMDSLPKDSLDLIGKQNTENIQKTNEEMNKLSDIESRYVTVSSQFAKMLYKKAVSLIDNFKGIGRPALFEDGYLVTFRAVVDDEVWSLEIHEPEGKALKMSNLCKQIITETLSEGKIDESKYIKILDEFD